MKYMFVWSIEPERYPDATKIYTAGTEPTDGVTVLDRWFSLGTSRGFALVETDNPLALKKYTRFWQEIMKIEIVPVINEEENRQSMGL